MKIIIEKTFCKFIIFLTASNMNLLIKINHLMIYG